MAALVFLATSFLINFIIAVYKSCFSSAYRDISRGKLSMSEVSILRGKASIGTRLSVFFINFAFGLTFPIFIFAGIITFFYYLISLLF